MECEDSTVLGALDDLQLRWRVSAAVRGTADVAEIEHPAGMPAQLPQVPGCAVGRYNSLAGQCHCHPPPREILGPRSVATVPRHVGEPWRLISYRYASASRTVMREARVAAASVASVAPRTASAIQMPTAAMEILKGSGAKKNRLPSPAPRRAVRPSVGNAATIRLATARKTPSAVTIRRTLAGRAPIACMTPNSRVRSRTLALMVDASPIPPITPMAIEIPSTITMIGPR